MQLRDRLSKDYGLAIIGDGDDTPRAMVDRLEAGDGVPILSIANGPIGVLRAMSVRCGRVAPNGPFTLAVVKLADGVIALYWWRLIGKDGASC